MRPACICVSTGRALAGTRTLHITMSRPQNIAGRVRGLVTRHYARLSADERKSLLEQCASISDELNVTPEDLLLRLQGCGIVKQSEWNPELIEREVALMLSTVEHLRDLGRDLTEANAVQVLQPEPGHVTDDKLLVQVIRSIFNVKVLSVEAGAGMRSVRLGGVARPITPAALQKRLAKARALEEKAAERARAAKRARAQLEQQLGQ